MTRAWQAPRRYKSLQLSGHSSYGGGDYLLLRWCDFLLRHGWQVDVLASDPTVVAELRKIQGVRVWDQILIPRDIAPMGDWRALRQVIGLLRREQYDVVHTYTAVPGFLGRVAARYVGTPVILHHQAGWTVTEFSTAWERAFYTPLEYLATAISSRSICVSHAVARQARELRIAPLGKLVTICNGIEPQPLIAATRNGAGEAVRRELGIPAGHLVIGNTGRLAPQKDNATLIRAMASLRALMADMPFSLLLAGDGPERPQLEGLARSLQLGERVRFLGFRRDIPAFIAALDVFASPSLWEGLSISLLEAMVAARPIVATAIQPNAELIEHEATGLLVTPRAPDEIAQAIVRFVREPDLARRCAAAARERVLERYTIDRMLQETLDLYLSLLEAKRGVGI